MKNVFFSINQPQSGYTWNGTFNAAENSTIGQVCGQIAKRINQRLVMTKASGKGKGLNLRLEFHLSIELDGQTLLNTANIDDELRKVIRGGLTSKSQGRFGAAIAYCVHSEHMDKVTQYQANLCDDDAYTADDLAKAIRFALDCKATELA